MPATSDTVPVVEVSDGYVGAANPAIPVLRRPRGTNSVLTVNSEMTSPRLGFTKTHPPSAEGTADGHRASSSERIGGVVFREGVPYPVIPGLGLPAWNRTAFTNGPSPVDVLRASVHNGTIRLTTAEKPA